MQTFLKSRFISIIVVFFAVTTVLITSCNEAVDSIDEPFSAVFTSFTFQEQTGEARINNDLCCIDINARCGTNLDKIIPEFTLSSEYVIVKIGSVQQVSGKSEVNFSEGPVVYTLFTTENKIIAEWKINVTLHEDCQANWLVNLQKRNCNGSVEKFMEKWNSEETAIIVIDMWPDQAFEKCAHNSVRELDMSLKMNSVFDVAREMGILIVFAPSAETEEFEKWYGNLPARRSSEKYRHGYGNHTHWSYWWHGRGGEREYSGLAFPGEKDAYGFPRESGRGCDYKTINNEPQPPQIPELIIKDNDIITDDFIEMIGGRDKFSGRIYEDCLFKERGIKNVIVTGCHTDICIIGRPFGARALIMAGYNVALCRDLTNCTLNCNMFEKNGRSHIEMLDKICNYIETWICPTITSTEITGSPPFQFDEEKIEKMFPPRKKIGL